MTCEEIRELILLLPFDQHRSRTRAALEAHARNCEYCRAELRGELSLSASLRALPEIPATVVDDVLAHIAAIDERRSARGASEARVTAPTAIWRPWAAFAGLAAVVVVYLQAVFSGRIDFDASRPLVGIGHDGLLSGAYSLPAAVGLAVAAFAYLASVFAVTRDH